MTATLLPIPDSELFQELIDAWPDDFASFRWPRSSWLRDFEDLLRAFYPSANSRSLSLTARHAAPFPLALGPDVP